MRRSLSDLAPRHHEVGPGVARQAAGGGAIDGRQQDDDLRPVVPQLLDIPLRGLDGILAGDAQRTGQRRIRHAHDPDADVADGLHARRFQRGRRAQVRRQPPGLHGCGTAHQVGLGQAGAAQAQPGQLGGQELGAQVIRRSFLGRDATLAVLARAPQQRRIAGDVAQRIAGAAAGFQGSVDLGGVKNAQPAFAGTGARRLHTAAGQPQRTRADRHGTDQES